MIRPKLWPTQSRSAITCNDFSENCLKQLKFLRTLLGSVNTVQTWWTFQTFFDRFWAKHRNDLSLISNLTKNVYRTPFETVTASPHRYFGTFQVWLHSLCECAKKLSTFILNTRQCSFIQYWTHRECIAHKIFTVVILTAVKYIGSSSHFYKE